MLEIEGLRLSEAKIFRCAGSLRRCAPALARRLRRRAYPDLYVDPRHPGGPVTTPRVQPARVQGSVADRLLRIAEFQLAS